MDRVKMGTVKNIIMIAHDHRKQDLLEWVKYNRAVMVDARNYYGLLKAASDGTLAATEDGQAIIKATK